jgi:hypothetical protein
MTRNEQRLKRLQETKQKTRKLRQQRELAIALESEQAINASKAT